MNDQHALEQLAYETLEVEDLARRGVIGRVEVHDDLDEIRQGDWLFSAYGWQRCRDLETGRFSHNVEYKVYKRLFDSGWCWATVEAAICMGVYAYFEVSGTEPY